MLDPIRLSSTEVKTDGREGGEKREREKNVEFDDDISSSGPIRPPTV